MYASELGNCEQISQDLFGKLKKNHGPDDSIFAETKRIAMNHYNQVEFQSKEVVKIVVFLTSSTGDGEFPENGLKFQSYLRKESSSSALSHVFYTILGLGDSNYSKFQGAPRFLDQRLGELGAHKFYERGEADDATNLALVVEPWLAGLPSALKLEIQRLKSLSQNEFKKLQELSITSQDEIFTATTTEDQSTTNYRATLVDRVLVCEDQDKQVYKVKLQLARGVSRERLDVGQSIQVIPRNRQADVDKIISAFGWNKDQLIGNHTIEQMLLSKIDISKRKLNLEGLVKHFQMFTSDFEEDLTRLMGQDRTKFTLLELVEKSDPFVQGRFMLGEGCLEDGLLKLQPRYYSILHDPYIQSTDGIADECKDLTLSFTLCKFNDDFGQERNGLCTSYLAQENLNATVDCQISKNTRILQLPVTTSADLKLMIICMGTGVVPFIGMLERIQALGRKVQVQMFYGVRNNEQSFYFGEWLMQFFAAQDSNSHLHVSCSRALSTDSRHQNVIFEQGRLQQSLQKFCLKKFLKVQEAGEVEPLPDSNTHILICGNRNALQKSVFESLQMSESVKKELQQSGRLLMELWSE